MIGVSKKSKYIYSNKVASKRNIQSLSVDNLMGVDYSSSMLNIQDNHAYDIKNFLKQNGTLQKRPPIEQIGLTGLNGVWECNYKGTIYTIAHKGNNLYLVDGIENYDRLANNYYLLDGNATIKDQKSWGVFTNDRLYILCGNYIVVKFTDDISIDGGLVEGIGHYNVYNDIDTYIPTTTIGIGTSKNSTINRTSLDMPNIMTNKRKNTITTLLENEEEYNVWSTTRKEYFALDYQVDRNIFNTNSVNQILIKYDFLDNKDKKKSLTLYGNFEFGGEQSDSGIVFKTNISNLGDITNESNANGEVIIFKIYFDTPNVLDCFFVGKPLDNSVDNVSITFPTSTNESDLIHKCTFGVMYGAGGNRNRLFVTGNPNKPNVDYHTSRRNIYANDSDVDLQDSQDLTYFSVYDYCAYGTSNTAITDYQIMGDGSLMVLKEESPNEPNIYFRDSNYETKTISLNDVETQVIEETYPMRVGNIGEGAIKSFNGTLHNLNNDLVFLSDNGVFGISSTVSAGQLNSDYKYSYGRSRLINSKLKQDLRNAQNVATCVYDHKYFITLKKQNGKYITYVADGRYTYKIKDSVDNEYEYEWFVLDGIEADKYFVVDNTLYFSNQDGLYVFHFNKKIESYNDKVNIPLYEGDLITYNNGSYAVYSNVINEAIKNNKCTFMFETQYGGTQENIGVLVTENFVCQNGLTSLGGISDKAKFFISLQDQLNLKFYHYLNSQKHYLTFKEYDGDDENWIYVYDSNGNPVDIRLSSWLMFEVADLEFDINVNEDTNEITSLSLLGEDCEFYEFDYTPTNFSLLGKITVYKKIQCYYLTKSYNFGQSVYAKYLKSMTMINDSEQLSYTDFGIITKEVKKRFEENSYSGTNGLVDTYANIFKADLTTGRFSTSFTKDYLLKFNFIQFEFYNNDDTNCIVNNFTILYTTGFKTKGVS